MKSFKKELEKKLIKSRYNNYGVENYDEFRFGKFSKVNEPHIGILIKFKRVIKKTIGYKKKLFLKPHIEFLEKYEDRLQFLYNQLNLEGQVLVVNIIAYRLLGYRKVMLPRNNKEYWAALDISNSLCDPKDTYDPHFLHFILQKCDLKKIGYDIELYYLGSGVAIDFFFEQYAYKSENKPIVVVEKGDVVLDLGGCWGDTALYFASKTGESGKVFSFEFIPDNLKLFNLNISLNPTLQKLIEIIPRPVSNKSYKEVYFFDKGPGSKIQLEPFEGQTGIAMTLSIDDFVKEHKIDKVNFIKMDIEGAELGALEGATETIKRFMPKLAIAIYHNLDDFVNIPLWISELGLGYKLYLDHYTIHSEETVIFAKVER